MCILFSEDAKHNFRAKQKILSSVGFLGQSHVYTDPCSFMPLLCRSELLSHFLEEGTLELWLPPVRLTAPGQEPQGGESRTAAAKRADFEEELLSYPRIPRLFRNCVLYILNKSERKRGDSWVKGGEELKAATEDMSSARGSHQGRAK